MINLIPPAARAKVKREYWIRVASVWMWLIAIAIAMVTLLHIPTFVLIKGQINVLSDPAAEAESHSQEFVALKAAIDEANQLQASLVVSSETLEFSKVLNEIDQLSGSAITISSYELSRTDAVVSAIVVRGEAATRVALANFKTDLEAHELFSTAELPISNLAKDVDIPFNIEITPANQTES